MYSPIWLLKGLTRSVPGELELSKGRLTMTIEESQLFDVPLSQVTGITFPWYYFGGGMKFNVGGDHYRISFVQPGDAGDIVSGRQTGKAWRALLDPKN